MTLPIKTPITVADKNEAALCAKGTVYLVDDEPELLEGLSDILTFEGYVVHRFPSGEAYLSFIQKIKDIANSAENLMPSVIEAVENKCTLGEIAHALRSVWGEWQ